MHHCGLVRNLWNRIISIDDRQVATQVKMRGLLLTLGLLALFDICDPSPDYEAFESREYFYVGGALSESRLFRQLR